jgi:cytochrome c-type biogenesis protein CcmF
MPTTEVSITSSLREDLYVVMASVDADTRVGHFKAYVNPLTVWLWLGGVIMVIGVLTAMWPDASRAAAAALTARRDPSAPTPEEPRANVA